jgi:hypothetical protein
VSGSIVQVFLREIPHVASILRTSHNFETCCSVGLFRFARSVVRAVGDRQWKANISGESPRPGQESDPTSRQSGRGVSKSRRSKECSTSATNRAAECSFKPAFVTKSAGATNRASRGRSITFTFNSAVSIAVTVASAVTFALALSINTPTRITVALAITVSIAVSINFTLAFAGGAGRQCQDAAMDNYGLYESTFALFISLESSTSVFLLFAPVR